MADTNVIAQVRPGMELHTADGSTLGKVTEVWIGTDPMTSTAWCDEEVCSRLEVHHRGGTLYIPYNAIAGVSGGSVTLKVDAAAVNEKGWYRKPLWIEAMSPTTDIGPTNPFHT